MASLPSLHFDWSSPSLEPPSAARYHLKATRKELHPASAQETARTATYNPRSPDNSKTTKTTKTTMKTPVKLPAVNAECDALVAATAPVLVLDGAIRDLPRRKGPGSYATHSARQR